jgi:toxin ParE1/3/4
VAYKLSVEADADLENLELAGILEFGLAQATAYMDGLVDALEFLARFPLAARARPEISPDTRGHPYKSHMIFYRLDGPDIFILRVRHGREDWRPS